jgi:phosphate acetyltransferase
MHLTTKDQWIENKLFEEINIGDSIFEEKQVSQDIVNLFAVISNDLNPTHIDSYYAKEVSLKNTTVHSMLSGSFFSSLLGNKLPGPGTTYISQELNFHQPLYTDENIKISITVRNKSEQTQIIDFYCKVESLDRELVIVDGYARVKAPATKVKHHIENQLNITFVDKHAKHKELINKANQYDKSRMAIVYPCDEPSLGGAIGSTEENLIIPILIGPKEKILEIANKLNKDISNYEIIDEKEPHLAAEIAVNLVKEGKADSIMKGSLHTDELMGAVVRGIRTKSRISHVFYMDAPRYIKPLLITDAAINIEPTLEDKIDIIQNSIYLAHSLGIESPRVAILAAVETVNPKMRSTMEAAALCKMSDRGQIKGGLLDGPLAFDNAISLQAAKTKGIKSLVAGQADILVAPNLEAGNIFAKQLEYLADAVSAGIVLGAKCPIALTSRADTQDVRIASAALCCIYSNYLKKK